MVAIVGLSSFVHSVIICRKLSKTDLQLYGILTEGSHRLYGCRIQIDPQTFLWKMFGFQIQNVYKNINTAFCSTWRQTATVNRALPSSRRRC